jgi:hypothetical protein
MGPAAQVTIGDPGVDGMIESGSKPFAGELQKTIKNPSDFL